LGFGIVIPLLPLYGRYFSGSDEARAWVLGALMASFSAMQFLFAPIWGRLSDRIGRRPVLMLGLLGSVVFYTLFGLATVWESLVWLFVGRIGAGICGATISTAQAYIADTTSLEDRPKGMALIGAAFGLGFTFGPLFGALAFPTGDETPTAIPGYLAAGLSAAALLLAVWKLPESLRPDSRKAAHAWIDVAALRRAVATPSIGWLLLASFVCVLAFGNFETTLSLLLRGEEGLIVVMKADASEQDIQAARQQAEQRGLRSEMVPGAERTLITCIGEDHKTERAALAEVHGVAEVVPILDVIHGEHAASPDLAAAAGAARGFHFRFRRIFYTFSFIGLVLMVVQGGVVRRIAGRVSEAAMAVIGALLELVGFALMVEAIDQGSTAWLFLALASVVSGFAFLTPSINSLLSRRSDPAWQGAILGLGQSVSALARILAPVLGMQLFHRGQSLPFWVGGALMAAAGGLVLIAARRGADYGVQPADVVAGP
jgi:MFS family permease